MDEEDKIDLFDPATVMFFIMGGFSDLAFLGLLGLAIPAIGLAIAMFVLGAHYSFGIIIIFYFWGKTRGWLPKVFLLLSWILPLPTLTIGIVLAILTSNKVVALIVEQVAIQAVAVATAGAGEALEGAAVAAEGAEVATTAAEGAEAAGAAAEGAEVVGGAAEAGGAAAEAGAEGVEAGAEAAGESAGENIFENPLDNPVKTAGEEEFNPEADQFHEGEGSKKEEAPKAKEPEGKNKTSDRVKKVFDIANRTNKDEEEGDNNQAADEELDEAA
jgi:type IV secretory pathway TrbL component